MGFVAAEQVEELTYDFRPHEPVHGTIAEPPSKAVDDYRNAVFGALRDSGLDPEIMKAGVPLDQIDTLLKQTDAIEQTMLEATAALTGIDATVLGRLPYRVKSAFLGWVMGQFFNPEA